MKTTMISIAAWLVFGVSVNAEIWRVDPAATGTGDGSSWANAKTDLNATIVYDALLGDEVWVIAGTYIKMALLREKELRVYGGFAGTETLASQSDPSVNRTYLIPESTPDSNGNKRALGARTDFGSTTVVRGFWIINGTTKDDWVSPGAGVKLTNCDMAFIDCVFENNNSGGLGGAVAVLGGSPTFINCRFLDNLAKLGGAAVSVEESGTPTFINCLFDGNDAKEGGAIDVFTGSAQLVNCTVANNIANTGGGGGLCDYMRDSVVRNGIVWGNTSPRTGAASIYSTPGDPAKVTATHSDIQGSWTGAMNLDTDPRFIDSVGGNFRLVPTDPTNTLVDAGDNTVLPADDYDLDWDGDLLEAIPIDLGGAPRIQGVNVDMGAFEGVVSVVGPDTDPGRPDTGYGSMGRYISIKPTNAGVKTALRVTLTNLPAPFADHNGETMWVGPPVKACPNSAQPSWPCSPMFPMFWASNLRCTPFYRNWSTISTLYIYDDEFVPGATYEVQAVQQGWAAGFDESYSSSLTVATSVWGDITGGFDFGTNTWTPPDGSIDLSTDISAVLDAVNGVAYAPHKSRCDLDPNVPNSLVDQGDVDAVLDGFSGVNYPFGGPNPCP